MSRTIKLDYGGFAAFDENARELNLELDPDSGHLHLTKGVTYADEMGNCNIRDIETISRTQWIRKAFWIDDPVADSAALLPYISNNPKPGSRLRITINEEVVKLHRMVRLLQTLRIHPLGKSRIRGFLKPGRHRQVSVR